MANNEEGGERKSHLAEEMRSVVTTYSENKVWDTVKARDVDPKILEYVKAKIEAGVAPGKICQVLGIPSTANVAWRKILAALRGGMRADAELYLYNKTQECFKAIDVAKDTFFDAVENGTPQVVMVGHGEGRSSPETIRVKGATKELAGFLKAYLDAVERPLALWDRFGAVGEKQNAGLQGTTIVVQNRIQMPSVEEIRKHKEEIVAAANTIEVKGKTLGDKN